MPTSFDSHLAVIALAAGISFFGCLGVLVHMARERSRMWSRYEHIKAVEKHEEELRLAREESIRRTALAISDESGDDEDLPMVSAKRAS